MWKDKEAEKEDKKFSFEEKRRAELLKYEKKKHYEFLNQAEELLTDNLIEKLRSYSIILTDQLNWEIKEQYLDLLDKFINKKMDSYHFNRSFRERYKSIEKIAEILKLNRVFLSPDKNSFDFGEFLSEIDDCCLAYSDAPEPYRTEFDLGDAEFKVSIEKIYFQMKQFLKK
jgi:hypothetical protein